MRISQDIRNYAKDKDLNTTEAIHQGMQEKAEEFKKQAVKFTNNERKGLCQKIDIGLFLSKLHVNSGFTWSKS